MEVPELVVVDIVDADGSGHGLVDLVAGAQVHREELADALVGVAVLLFSTIGVAVFFLPLLAGAFK